jgi:hypothetical protein
LSNAASLLILSLLVLLTFTSGQACAAEQVFSNSAQLQVTDGVQHDNFKKGEPVDDWQSGITLPHRLSASEFQHQKQLTPNYELTIEFLAEDLAAKHFVYIHTIPDIQPWFEVTAFIPRKSRLSGWKDSRPLRPFIFTPLIES